MPTLIKEYSSRQKTVRIRILTDNIRHCLKASISFECGKRLTVVSFEPVPLLFFLYEIGKNATFTDISLAYQEDGKLLQMCGIYDSRTKSDRVKIAVIAEESTVGEVRIPVRVFRDSSLKLREEIPTFINSLASVNRS